MGKFVMIFGAGLCVLFSCVFFAVWNILYSVPARPMSADENPWWGTGQKVNEKVVIKEFTVNISDSVS